MDGSQNIAAVTTAVCGMVSDGTWALLDTLWVPAINSAGNAVLNWPNTSFSLTPTNSPTFAANQGYTGNGTNSYLASSYNLSSSSTNYTLNSWRLHLHHDR
jgi:hypothetical protein